MVVVTLESEDGRICSFEMPDDWMRFQGIDEGDEWPEDLDDIDPDSELAEQLSKIMNTYYDALDELEKLSI